VNQFGLMATDPSGNLLPIAMEMVYSPLYKNPL
jgi:hypothetical protein